MMVALYNSLLLLIDLGVLASVRRSRAFAPALMVMFLAAGVAEVIGLAITSDRFLTLQLWCWGLFVHGVIQLAGTAWLLRSVRPGAALSAVLAILLAAVGIDAFLIEPRWLEVTRYTVSSPKLHRPVRVAVLSDFQTDRIGDYERRVLEEAQLEHPDLILFPGDVLQDFTPAATALREAFRALIAGVHLQAPLGIFAVQGDVEKRMERLRWTFEGTPVRVLDRRTTLELGELTLTGLTLRESADVDLHIPAIDRFHLVFGHRPDFALGAVRADLLVAGHTHGGQVRLPFVGPLITLSQVPRAWADRRTALDGGRTLVVSRGIGMERGSAPRMRFLCRPELVIIDLVPVGVGPAPTVSPRAVSPPTISPRSEVAPEIDGSRPGSGGRPS